MKTFIIALIALVLLFSVCIINDLYCHNLCEKIIEATKIGNPNGAKNALQIFTDNEFLLKCSVDNGYVSEAKVSLCSLAVAYECNDGYEIKRYSADCIVRITRIKTALFI